MSYEETRAVREPSGRSRVHADAPDAAQEQLRAEAGFPWCDTCKAPAVLIEHRGYQHASVIRDGRHLRGAPVEEASDHKVTIREWNAADPW